MTQLSMRAERSPLLEPFNISGLLAIIALCAFSVLIQADAHFYAGGPQYDRHVLWVMISAGAFIVGSFIDMRLVERVTIPYYILCMILLVATLFVGTSVNNSTRWLRLGSLNIQASEFVKLAVILVLSQYLHRRKERKPGETGTPQSGKYDTKDLIKPLALVLAPTPLVLMQPDLGTTLMIIFVAGTMLFIEGVKRKTLMGLGIFVLVLAPLAWSSGLIKDYQKDRVRLLAYDEWQKIDFDTNTIHSSRRTQAEQSMWAIGAGGLMGAGWRNADLLRMSVFPEVHTDFISAMVAEQFGLLGMTGMLFLFWWTVIWCLRTGVDSRSIFCRNICIGVGALMAWQVFVNLGMVMNFLPVVGVPLPFISYGGSAFLMKMACLGLVVNIARRRGRL